ncbi:hypothetical protein [Paraburkholderia hospita]|uniref:Uncharacterized protein n=1 Tax=Paraburkholderia hospita TaxID=169430 RepID=A0AAN1MR71_9BURK|nr:hypothetical protein [Paraburkholderia hospita]AUT76389.1 hypothetical protein C2L64_50035 [Paraburkholderia hospita]OUL84832.1 hypothetical protein CA603_24560 [Paraburkholderia hospita]SEI27212.1 hypothetical protein SAMN05192544_108333 [Paraburkholderia hospita]
MNVKLPSVVVSYVRQLRISLCIGALVYFAYGTGTSMWESPWLSGTAMFMALSAPLFSFLCNFADAAMVRVTRLVTMGKLGRFLVQLTFNLIFMSAVVHGGLVSPVDIAHIGGVPGAALLATLVSQGTQYVAVLIASCGFGTRDGNVTLGYLVSVSVIALSMLGHPHLQHGFEISSMAFGGFILALGLIKDARWLAGLAMRRLQSSHA